MLVLGCMSCGGHEESTTGRPRNVTAQPCDAYAAICLPLCALADSLFSVASRRLGQQAKRHSIQLDPNLRRATEGQVMTYEASDELIEQIWCDMHQVIPRRRITEVARQVAAGFVDAKITAFIPLFVRRFTRERLLPEMAAA